MPKHAVSTVDVVVRSPSGERIIYEVQKYDCLDDVAPVEATPVSKEVAAPGGGDRLVRGLDPAKSRRGKAASGS